MEMVLQALARFLFHETSSRTRFLALLTLAFAGRPEPGTGAGPDPGTLHCRYVPSPLSAAALPTVLSASAAKGLEGLVEASRAGRLVDLAARDPRGEARSGGSVLCPRRVRRSWFERQRSGHGAWGNKKGEAW